MIFRVLACIAIALGIVLGGLWVASRQGIIHPWDIGYLKSEVGLALQWIGEQKGTSAGEELKRAGYNIILISLDTLREREKLWQTSAI